MSGSQPYIGKRPHSFERLSLKLAIDIYDTYGSQFLIKNRFENLEFKIFLVSKIEQIVPQLTKLFTENAELISRGDSGYEQLEELIVSVLDGNRNGDYHDSGQPDIKYTLNPPVAKFLIARRDLCEKIYQSNHD